MNHESIHEVIGNSNEPVSTDHLPADVQRLGLFPAMEALERLEFLGVLDPSRDEWHLRRAMVVARQGSPKRPVVSFGSCVVRSTEVQYLEQYPSD